MSASNPGQLTDRITVNAELCGGRPCVRGMRIRVSDVLDLLAAGLTATEVVAELPEVEAEDVVASLNWQGIDCLNRAETKA